MLFGFGCGGGYGAGGVVRGWRAWWFLIDMRELYINIRDRDILTLHYPVEGGSWCGHEGLRSSVTRSATEQYSLIARVKKNKIYNIGKLLMVAKLEPLRGAYLLLFYNPSRSTCAVEKGGYFNNTRCTDEADSPTPRVLSITRCTCRAMCFQELQDNDYQLHVFPGTPTID